MHVLHYSYYITPLLSVRGCSTMFWKRYSPLSFSASFGKVPKCGVCGAVRVPLSLSSSMCEVRLLSSLLYRFDDHCCPKRPLPSADLLRLPAWSDRHQHGTLNPVEIALGAGARFSFSDRPFDVSLPLVSEFALNHAEFFSIEFYFLTI